MTSRYCLRRVIFYGLWAYLGVACQAGNLNRYKSPAAADGTDPATGPDSTSGVPGNANVAPEVVTIDGTVVGQILRVGGPPMPWPPPGVSAVPPLGQTCEAVLAADGKVPTEIPVVYYTQCAGCHGPEGKGSAAFPNLRVSRTFDSFSSILRSGRTGKQGVMPSYDEDHLNNSDLVRLYAYLTGSPYKEMGQCAPAPTWSDDEVDDVLAKGLAAWRKQDPAGHDGVGCFQCHGPDGLTFAYMGQSDGDIFRRGLLHLPPNDVVQIVDMVHAYRQRYAIEPRDPLVARPFQPGSGVLAGDSAKARDLNFGRQLKSMGLLWANRPITKPEEARQAAAELARVNLHALPIPIPFNHLTEDVYHNDTDEPIDCSQDIDGCKDHGSMSDWMPIQPHVPPNLPQFFAAADSYLSSPNLATFYRNFGAIPRAETMPGTYPIGYNYAVDDHKYRSEFILDFCIRQELLGKPGCLEGPGIFDPNKHITNIWGEGEYANLFATGLSKQPACDVGEAPCNPPQSPHFYTNLSKGAKISDSFQRLRVPWFNIQWAHFDPTMLNTGDATIQQSEYFTRDIFWANNDEDYDAEHVNDTYSIYGIFQVIMHNIKVLSMPETASCDKIPFTHPDLGVYPCTALDLRSGYFPQLCNFAEGKNWYNDSNQQLGYVPRDAERKAIYQLLGANLYRIFLWGLIDNLQQDNWMCDADMQSYRIKRAKAFLAQPEIVASNGEDDARMFATLAALMEKSRKECPALDKTKPAEF